MASATSQSSAIDNNTTVRSFIWASIAAGLWLNLSEVVRYFVFVMPMTREAFPSVPNVAPMNLTVFSIWGVWMTLLTLLMVYLYWLHALKFGHTGKAIFISATVGWVFFFVLFWLGNYNMGLAHPSAIAIALPWAWAELVITCWIAQMVFSVRGQC